MDGLHQRHEKNQVKVRSAMVIEILRLPQVEILVLLAALSGGDEGHFFLSRADAGKHETSAPESMR